MADRSTADYWSDVLCVWAWIAQPRLNEALAARLRVAFFIEGKDIARQEMLDAEVRALDLDANFEELLRERPAGASWC